MLVATWFGVGLLPFAPGTWGSLAALPIGWAIYAVSGEAGLAAAAAIVFAAGWLAASLAAKHSSVNDPAAIVVDEVAAQWLTLLAAPPSIFGWGLAFVLFRLFD
ncbi:MAG TPA: phosphatidylglycerophosphatase A, partial [Stellaceae bacterium]